MPIFSRRRLQSMLVELSNHLDTRQKASIVTRIEHRNTKTALAAEAELSLLWAISRVAHLEVEPQIPNSSRRPDASSSDLFPSAPAIIEIRALSDDSFSGKEAMDRTANIIAAFADGIRKGAGKHLYFTFNERTYWDRRFHRERCVTMDFKLTLAIERTLTNWLKEPDWPNPKAIRICDGATDVIVSWQDSTVPSFRVFSKMPAVAYDLEDNPIFKALRKKAKQIKGTATGSLRCVFLVDVGCDLLRRLRPLSSGWEIGGEKIIRHAIDKLSIDLVCVFSPYREHDFTFGFRQRLIWRVTYFDHREDLEESEYECLRKTANQLPPPHYEGYQARSLHMQKVFSPQSRGQYVATNVITRPGVGKMTIRLSSRLLQEYLAGKMSFESFSQTAFGGNNLFHRELIAGCTIQNVHFESGGMDEDDDFIVFDLEPDWGARSLGTIIPSGDPAD